MLQLSGDEPVSRRNMASLRESIFSAGPEP
jgi:hypothetical protein